MFCDVFKLFCFSEQWEIVFSNANKTVKWNVNDCHRMAIGGNIN